MKTASYLPCRGPKTAPGEGVSHWSAGALQSPWWSLYGELLVLCLSASLEDFPFLVCFSSRSGSWPWETGPLRGRTHFTAPAPAEKGWQPSVSHNLSKTQTAPPHFIPVIFTCREPHPNHLFKQYQTHREASRRAQAPVLALSHLRASCWSDAPSFASLCMFY